MVDGTIELRLNSLTHRDITNCDTLVVEKDYGYVVVKNRAADTLFYSTLESMKEELGNRVLVIVSEETLKKYSYYWLNRYKDNVEYIKSVLLNWDKV